MGRGIFAILVHTVRITTYPQTPATLSFIRKFRMTSRNIESRQSPFPPPLLKQSLSPSLLTHTHTHTSSDGVRPPQARRQCRKAVKYDSWLLPTLLLPGFPAARASTQGRRGSRRGGEPYILFCLGIFSPLPSLNFALCICETGVWLALLKEQGKF